MMMDNELGYSVKRTVLRQHALCIQWIYLSCRFCICMIFSPLSCKESGTALLGVDLIKGLQLCFNGATSSTIPMMSLFPTSPLQSIVGCAKQFVHKVMVSHAVTPVQQRVRCLPLSVWDAVSKETDTLLKERTEKIESPDASECVWICGSQARLLF